MRVPSSRFSEFTVSPIFFPRVPLMNPLQLWVCHDVAAMISASVAPFARRSKSRMVAVLLPARAPSGCAFAAFGVLGAAFVGGVFLGLAAAAALGLAPLAVFWPLGAPFFVLAPFFEEAFSGATM